MSVPNLLKLVLHWKGLGEEGTLSWHFLGNQALHTPAQLQAAAGAVVTNWGSVRTPSSKTQLLGKLWVTQSVDLVTLYEYASAPGKASDLGSTVPSGWTGTNASQAGPLQTSIVATLKTAQAGASYRGRQYFPGHCIPVTNTAGCASSTDVNTIAQLAANMGPEAASAIATSLSISTLQWVVFSPTKGAATVINGVRVDSKLDTQRRREANLKADYTTTVSV